MIDPRVQKMKTPFGDHASWPPVLDDGAISRLADSVDSFKAQFKTHLFAKAYQMQLYCIYHFCSASHSTSLSEALPTTAIDTVSEFTRRNATGNCMSRTCPSSLRGGYSGIRTHDPPVESHRLNQLRYYAPQP